MNIFKTMFLKHKNDKNFGGPLRYPKPGIYGEEYSNLFRDFNNESEIVLTTGFGIPADGKVPLRLPSLFIPGVKIIEQLLEKGVNNCKYVIYQTPTLIKEINGIDEKIADKTSKIQMEYIHEFLDKICENPEVKNRIIIKTFDDSLLDEKIASAVKELGVFLKNKYLSEDQNYGSVFQLIEYAKKQKKDDDAAFLYLAINIIYNQGFSYNPVEEHLQDKTDDPKIIIPIGGQKEKPFFDLTHRVSKDFNIKNIVMPMLHTVGEVPTYYSQREEPLIGENVDNKIYNGCVKKDLEILENTVDFEILTQMTNSYQK